MYACMLDQSDFLCTARTGPGRLAFLRKRREQKLANSNHEGDKASAMDISKVQLSTKSDIEKGSLTEKSGESSERSLPGKWLHMDVMEKEKMEWMTDVPLYPRGPSLSPGESEPREVRFSLDGLVIPRTVQLPVHLGLHHHGNEPQVSICSKTMHTYCACTCMHTCILQVYMYM